jgi:DNA primase
VAQENKVNLEVMKERVKPYLKAYLSSQGVNMNSSDGKFRCINPAHPDNNPSMGIVPSSDGKVFHCFSCHCSGDIFTAAAMIEGKPSHSKGFVTDNLRYLAARFGVDLPDIPELSKEELHIMDTHSAYNHASMILRTANYSDKVKSKLAELGWERANLDRLGAVGSVSSYEDYISQMTGKFKHEMDFLEKIDLANRRIFNENRLIFIVRNEHGAPVGFASRDLQFEEKKKAWEAEEAKLRQKHANDTKAFEEARRVLLDSKPVKFINTHDRCPIYSKRELLFLFDSAKKHSPPLWVLEGYGDGVTAQMGGMKNASAIGATAFTREHLEMILNSGIKHIVFVLDADEAGDSATERFVKMLEEVMSGRVGLKVEIVILPDGSDDPDKFIRSHSSLKEGVQAFRGLPRVDMFAWRIRQAVRNGEDSLVLAERTIPMIVNEANSLTRMSMTRKLSEQTGLDEKGLWHEVMRQVDSDVSAIEEEKVHIATALAKDILKNPRALSTILEQGRLRVENVEKRKIGYDLKNLMTALDETFERAEKSVSSCELPTGYNHFDSWVRGIPREQVFISVPGKPNQGKTSWLFNLAVRLIENEDVICLIHTADDPLRDAIPTILGAKYNIPREVFQKAGYFLNQGEEASRIIRTGQDWLREVTEEEKLLVADIGLLPADLPAMESWVRTLRNKYPSKHIVLFGDNFHIMDLPGVQPGEDKIRSMSKFIKRVCTEYHITGLYSMELPKDSLRPGVRPRIRNIKGSSGMAYDANANLGIYNDLKDMAEKATLVWNGPLERTFGPNGEELEVPRRMPIVEVVVDKSKISSFDGSIFFRLTPESGHMEECSALEQTEMKRRATNFHNSPAGEIAASGAPFRQSFSNA